MVLKQLYKNHYYTNYTVTDDGQSAGKDMLSPGLIFLQLMMFKI